MVLEILSQLTLVLLVGIILKAVGDKTKFPYLVLLMLAGLVLSSYGFLRISAFENFAEIIRTLALIIIVFSAGFYVKLSDLQKQSTAILSLSSVGVLITAFVIGGASYVLLSLPLITAALFGALLGGVDPAAIASEDSQEKEQEESKVMTVLKGESLLNTPLTVILPVFILDFLRVMNSQQEFFITGLVGGNIVKLFFLVVIGLIVGLAAYRTGKVLLQFSKGRYVQAIALILALSAFVIAENFSGSGILAVAVCSIFLANVRFPEKKWIGEFNKELAFIFTVFVFVLLGAQFTFADLIYVSKIEVLAVIVALVLGRVVGSFVALSRSPELSFNEKMQIALIAPKGLAPAALAPLLLSPIYGIAEAQKLVVITFVAILLSMLISLLFLKVFLEKPGKITQYVSGKTTQ